MKRKLIIRYVLLCLPFACGTTLYSLGVYNIVSSLLFFVGGYIAIKNLVDYRKINKNIRLVSDRKNNELEINNDNIDNFDEKKISKKVEFSDVKNYGKDDYNKDRSYDSIPGFKRTRRYVKVRRRIK